MGILVNSPHYLAEKNPEKVVSISTTIPISAYKEAKESGYKFNELLLLGLHSKKGMPNLMDRIVELEQGNEKLQRKLTALSLGLAEATK